MVSVEVEPSGTGLRFGDPRMLFGYSIGYSLTHPNSYQNYAVSLNGQRLLIARTNSGTAASADPLTVVLNWTAALKQ